MDSGLMFLDGPADLDRDGAERCGLPAEVRCRFVMEPTDGPLDSAMIRCPAGHWFTGPIESLTPTTGRNFGLKGERCQRKRPARLPVTRLVYSAPHGQRPAG